MTGTELLLWLLLDGSSKLPARPAFLTFASGEKGVLLAEPCCPRRRGQPPALPRTLLPRGTPGGRARDRSPPAAAPQRRGGRLAAAPGAAANRGCSKRTCSC